MKTEFNLSEKIISVQRENEPIIYLEDVKEFIRLLKEYVKNREPTISEILNFINIRAGEKLK